MENASVVTSLILTAYYDMEGLKYLYVITFLLLYIITIVLNFIIIVIICVDRALHEPMYLFVCNLAFNGLYGSTALLPPLLSNLLSHSHEVSVACCQAQSFCLHTYAFVEFTILAVMGYDRYIAICHPLQYHSIMSLSKVYRLIAFSWLYPIAAVAVIFSLTVRLIYCEEKIQKVYCSNYSFIKLSCTDTSVVNIIGLLTVVAYTIPQLILILYSYSQILRICLLLSKESQIKALKTCTPHLLAVINYSLGCFFEISQSRLNMSHVHYGIRLFMSLYFLIFPPMINPAIYGMNIQVVRVRIFKLFQVKSIPRRCAPPPRSGSANQKTGRPDLKMLDAWEDIVGLVEKLEAAGDMVREKWLPPPTGRASEPSEFLSLLITPKTL
ncbi:olfactory receptor 52D1-like [Megalops cyprinoides]|uniref:olfactory receptor 52D1-like n=1 Tax=Megalops cyprinoides TaxID=118141 RepID=UPI001865519C|nr:olfactory receptor 52D1-like [Megalops cyprinoides]